MTLPPSSPGGAATPPGTPAGQDARGAARQAGVFAAEVAASAILGVAGGFGWAAVAPRALLVMTGHGAAGLVNEETSAFIAADAAYCLICLAGGALAGLLGYLVAVRRHGPVAMAGLLLGGLAAALAVRWVGEQSGLATFHHLLSTLPAGARLRDSLRLGAGSALVCWPLAAGLVAGALELQAGPRLLRPRPSDTR